MARAPWDRGETPAPAPPPHRAPRPPELEPAWVALLPSVQSGLSVVLVVAVLFWVAGAWLSGRPPARADMVPEIEPAPVQTPIEAASFSFDYKSRTYDVQPVADYELVGLVMSRNNPRSVADAYHDSDSVDTRDWCVIWGPNLDIPLHRVSIKNSSWTCWVQWPRGVDFHVDALSNNHLITDSDAIRAQIERVRPGDQVRVHGMLVNYAPADKPAWKRNTSTVRTDDGGGACEVLFVEQIEVLRQGTPLPYALAGLGKWALLVALLGKLGLLWLRVARDVRARR